MDKEGFVRGLVKMANARAENRSPANTDELRGVIQQHDVVYGVWNDEGEPYGVGFHLIKGDQFLHTSVDTHRTLQTKLTAIPVASIEEAEAMRRVLGEVKRQH